MQRQILHSEFKTQMNVSGSTCSHGLFGKSHRKIITVIRYYRPCCVCQLLRMNPVEVMQSSANTQESKKNPTVIPLLLEGIFKKHGLSGEIMFPYHGY